RPRGLLAPADLVPEELMARTHGNGRSRSGGTRDWDDEVGEEPQVRVRCPNPDCEMIYTVPARYAGRKARCTRCGARTLIPSPRGPDTPAPRARLRKKLVPKRREEGEERAAGPEVRIGCVGRGHAGKTALFHALGESLVGDFLPSGLHLDA